MKTRFYIIILFTALFSINLCGQDKVKTLLLFEVEEANINGENVIQLYDSVKAFVVIFKNLTDSSLSMSICWRANKSQSFGVLRAHPMIVKNEPYQYLNATRSYYQLFYNKSYHEERGTANIELSQLFKPEGIYYVLQMTTDKFDLCQFEGYLVESSIGLISEDK